VGFFGQFFSLFSLKVKLENDGILFWIKIIICMIFQTKLYRCIRKTWSQWCIRKSWITHQRRCSLKVSH
jgi:hypothetical protein